MRGMELPVVVARHDDVVHERQQRKAQPASPLTLPSPIERDAGREVRQVIDQEDVLPTEPSACSPGTEPALYSSNPNPEKMVHAIVKRPRASV